MLFPRLIGVVAAVVRGFDIFTHISKIFRKQRQWGGAKWIFNRVMSLDN